MELSIAAGEAVNVGVGGRAGEVCADAKEVAAGRGVDVEMVGAEAGLAVAEGAEEVFGGLGIVLRWGENEGPEAGVGYVVEGVVGAGEAGEVVEGGGEDGWGPGEGFGVEGEIADGDAVAKASGWRYHVGD